VRLLPVHAIHRFLLPVSKPSHIVTHTCPNLVQLLPVGSLRRSLPATRCMRDPKISCRTWGCRTAVFSGAGLTCCTG
jgi:hypothetical protein